MMKFRVSVSIMVSVFAVTAFGASPTSIMEWSKRESQTLLPFYRDLHAHPELSLHEEKTKEKLVKVLTELGYDVAPPLGKTGIVAILKNGKGPRVMIRTDLDALPEIEATGLEYASKVTAKKKDGTDVGVMHACGHDVHMTTWIGVATYLAKHKSEWSGTVMMVGQPAEEIGEGALMLLGDGLFKKFPKPDVALALHVNAGLETGKISYRPGYALAGADSVDVVMVGHGGHGAMPHKAIDPITMGAQLVLDVQNLISREKDPADPGVITAGSFHCGTKHNIIPESCRVQFTVRSFSPESRKHLLDGIKRKADAIAQGAGAPSPVVTIEEDPVPPLYNDPKLVERVLPILKKTLGEDNVVLDEPYMVSEDFGRYGLEGVPIFMFNLGSIKSKRLEKMKSAKNIPSLHSAYYFPDAEETIRYGIAAMSEAAVSLLPSKP